MQDICEDQKVSIYSLIMCLLNMTVIFFTCGLMVHPSNSSWDKRISVRLNSVNLNQDTFTTDMGSIILTSVVTVQ